MRIENLDDKFEHHKQWTSMIDLEKLSQHILYKIYGQNNPDKVTVSIVETSLTGVQNYDDMTYTKA